MAVATSPRSVAGATPRTAKGLVGHALNTPLASMYLVLVSAGLLLGLGLLMVLSASSVYAEVNTGDSYYFVKRQLLFVAIGIGGALVLARLKLKTLRFLAWPSLLLATALLSLTFVPHLGVTVNGNRNWVQFGSSLTRFQPSEFAKVAIVLWGADLLARKEKDLGRPAQVLAFPLLAGVMIVLVMLQHDLGTSGILAAMVVGMLLLAGVPMRLMAALGVPIGALLAALIVSSPNRMLRIVGFLNPGADTDGINAQPLRGMYALATGGWWGLGLGQSKQKWGMLVEAHTDYVFAVIGEELGVLGTVSVIALFGILVYSAFRIALRSDDTFCRNAAVGVGCWFSVQALGNIAMVLRLLPVIGVPLPIVSYGGSSVLATLAGLGILLGCARQEPAARRVLAKRSRQTKPRVTAVLDGR